MRSDNLFYEMFQTAPQTFFELLQITPPCPYRFESVTVKTTEKRIDGILEPTQPDQPLYFVEVQDYPDKVIYSRTLREVFTYFEQRPTQQSRAWQAVVLWLDEKDDPGFGTAVLYDENQQQRLISLNLIDVLKKLDERSLVRNVLSPMLVDNATAIRQNFPTWVQQIHQNEPQPEIQERLLLVLTQLIEQKFKSLSHEELIRMLRLAPFEEMPTFVKTYERKLHEKFVDLLSRQVKRKYRFADSTMAKLNARLQKLPVADLEELFEEIIEMTTLREINAWVSARTPKELKEKNELEDRVLEVENF